jgi:hypothetical protein
MMYAQSLLRAVTVAISISVAIHGIHHVTTGSISPLTFASGIGPK